MLAENSTTSEVPSWSRKAFQLKMKEEPTSTTMKNTHGSASRSLVQRGNFSFGT